MKCRCEPRGPEAVAGADFLRGLPDDGEYTPVIKEHSLQKIRIHNYYASLFSTAMKEKWPQRAYVGLYSGPGRARLDPTGEIVETTSLSAMRVPHPFTKYMFVDNDPQCVKALAARTAEVHGSFDVAVIQGDVTKATADVIDAMPAYGAGRGLLSFCFVDPFSAELDFDVIRTLGTRYRMDFLVLLMLGVDVRQNFRRYLDDVEDTRIGRLVDDPNWREEWRATGSREPVRFLLRKFDQAMTRLGYQALRPDDAHPIRILGKNVLLYFLVLYSKDELGQKFWHATRLGADPQLGLGL